MRLLLCAEVVHGLHDIKEPTDGRKGAAQVFKTDVVVSFEPVYRHIRTTCTCYTHCQVTT